MIINLGQNLSVSGFWPLLRGSEPLCAAWLVFLVLNISLLILGTRVLCQLLPLCPKCQTCSHFVPNFPICPVCPCQKTPRYLPRIARLKNNKSFRRVISSVLQPLSIILIDQENSTHLPINTTCIQITG